MEKHELVDEKGNKTGKIITHIEAREPNNVPNGYYISVVGVVIINDKNEILLQKRSRFKRIPISSNVSRIPALSGVSPKSIFPPHIPHLLGLALLYLLRFCSKISFSSLIITTPTTDI